MADKLIQVQCNACNATLRAPDKVLDKGGTCPRCREKSTFQEIKKEAPKAPTKKSPAVSPLASPDELEPDMDLMADIGRGATKKARNKKTTAKYSDEHAQKFIRAADNASPIFGAIAILLWLGTLGSIVTAIVAFNNEAFEVAIGAGVYALMSAIFGIVIYSFRTWIINGSHLFARGMLACEQTKES